MTYYCSIHSAGRRRGVTQVESERPRPSHELVAIKSSCGDHMHPDSTQQAQLALAHLDTFVCQDDASERADAPVYGLPGVHTCFDTQA